MTAFEKFRQTLEEIGIPFELTDDSDESEIGECVDTVIVLKDANKPREDTAIGETYVFFKRNGSFKDISII